MNYSSSYISFEEARKVIIDALRQFNPELADHASHILHDKDRLNIVGVVNPITQMMQYRPSRDILKDHTEYGEVTQEITLRKKGIIDLEYDGRPSSVVWLAHELGHAIADEIQIENGHSGNNIFSDEENESQAYFVQQIVSKYIKDNLKHPDMSDDDLNTDISTMSAWRRAAYMDASQMLQKARDATVIEQQGIILRALDQRLG